MMIPLPLIETTNPYNQQVKTIFTIEFITIKHKNNKLENKKNQDNLIYMYSNVNTCNMTIQITSSLMAIHLFFIFLFVFVLLNISQEVNIYINICNF